MGRVVDERARRGPSAPRGEVAERILTRARESFAAAGYAATTLQGVARAAEVDTKLVRYYYHTKEGLFDACLAFPGDFVSQIRAAVDVPLEHRGEAAVRAMLHAWSDDDTAQLLRTSLLIAGHEPAAMAQVRAVYIDGLIPAITKDLHPEEVEIRGSLISSQMMGLSFARYVFALEGTLTIPDEQIIALVGATIQRYLTQPLTHTRGH